jgi:hypothetical protein
MRYGTNWTGENINPLNSELNTICYFLALLGAHHILHVSRKRVNHVFTLQRAKRGELRANIYVGDITEHGR